MDVSVGAFKHSNYLENAICLDGFSFNEAVRKSMREKYGAENNLIIGTVGRLSYQKNQNLLLRIFRQVANQHPNAMLWIVGDGEDRSSLEQQVKDLQLSDKVRFFGSRSNVADFLMAFDVFVLTSRWEGWGDRFNGGASDGTSGDCAATHRSSYTYNKKCICGRGL